MFRAPAMLLPHESTVAHEQRFIMDAPIISRTRSRQLASENAQVQEENEIEQITKDSLKLEDIQNLQVRQTLHDFQ